MKLLKPLLIRVLKHADYSQILRYVVEAKTGDRAVFNTMSAHSVGEAAESMDWLVSIARQKIGHDAHESKRV